MIQRRQADAGARARCTRICGFRWNIDELEKAITPKTRVLYLNWPNNHAEAAS